MISPFAGLPTAVQALFWFALVVIIAVDCWTCLLFARGRRVEACVPTTLDGAVDAFTWVFLVPALNEELTIRDSVERLLAIPVRERHVLVIDDASDDATPNILGAIGSPRTRTSACASSPADGKAAKSSGQR